MSDIDADIQHLKDTANSLLRSIENLERSVGKQAFEEVLSTTEASAILGVSRKTLERRGKSCYAIGGEKRFKVRQLAKDFDIPTEELSRLIRNHRFDQQEKVVPA